MRSYTISRNTLFIAILNIVLNLVLIKFIGVYGAGIASIVSFYLWNKIKLYYSKKIIGLELPTEIINGYLLGIALYSILVLYIQYLIF